MTMIRVSSDLVATIGAVVFDAGMTLVHPDHRVILRHLSPVLHDRQVPSRETILAALSLSAEVHQFGNGPEEDRRLRALDALCLFLGLATSCRYLLQDAIADPKLYGITDPQAVTVLQGLRSRGIAIAVVSNSDGSLTDDLASAGLLELVDSAVDSTVIGYAKPDPRIFIEACDRLGVPRQDSVYVGDDLGNDVLGALAAGYGDAFLFDPYNIYHVPGVKRIRRLDAILDLLDAKE